MNPHAQPCQVCDTPATFIIRSIGILSSPGDRGYLPLTFACVSHLGEVIPPIQSGDTGHGLVYPAYEVVFSAYAQRRAEREQIESTLNTVLERNGTQNPVAPLRPFAPLALNSALEPPAP